MATVLDRRRSAGADTTDATASVSTRRLGARGPSVDRLVMALVALVGLSIGFQPVGDNSFLTHLATGRRILTSGIPHADPYTFTARGTSWVVQSWLASVMYGGLDRLGGTRAIELVAAAATVALAMLLWHLSAPAGQLIGRLALVLPALVLGGGQWGERPYMFGLLALAGLLALEQGSGNVRWALPITWLWMQMHGSFPFGVAVLLCLALGQHLDGASSKRALSIAKWSVAGMAVGVVNPFGPKLLVFPVELLQRNEMLRNIVEWQSPSFNSWAERAFLVQLVIVVALLARRPSWSLAIPTMVFVPMALVSSRNLVVASLVLVAVAAPSGRGVGTISGHQRVGLGRVFVAVMAIFAVVVVASGLGRPSAQYQGYPVAALGWLAQQGHLTASSRVVAPDLVGNFLESAYGGAVPTYIDDRAELFPRAVFDDEVALLQATPAWRGALERAQPSAVIWPRRSPLTSVLLESSQWRSVYADPAWVVFEPR